MARLLLCLLGLLTTAAIAAEFDPPPPFRAEYELNKGMLTLGRATLTFSRPQPQRYRYRLYTRPTGIAEWFTDAEIRELSEGRIVPSGFQPLRYVYDRRGDEHARRAELRFDWSSGTVMNDVGEHPWRMDVPPDALDRVVSPLQLMHDLTERTPTSNERLTYRIADGGKLKAYHLTVEKRETVSTPAGNFETLRVVRRASDGDRITRLWCAPALDYLAVKVEQWEQDDGTFELVLTEVEGLPKAE
ncbi:DUF3108 domain-containing protein [Arhodomonas sp. AD133]|uniref:DUF3108 domain-containing protein n=1 Tax=Arhodomonas sp. AD133 TaxID=3415009 RepID=UPI003EBC61F3